jgi:hypothetical protein
MCKRQILQILFKKYPQSPEEYGLLKLKDYSSCKMKGASLHWDNINIGA